MSNYARINANEVDTVRRFFARKQATPLRDFFLGFLTAGFFGLLLIVGYAGFCPHFEDKLATFVGKVSRARIDIYIKNVAPQEVPKNDPPNIVD